MSLSDTLRRLPGEKNDKMYIASFEGVDNKKQLALWRTLKGKTRIKLENLESSIDGIKKVKCTKNSNLPQRLCDNQGVCVEVHNISALITLVHTYYEKSGKLVQNPTKEGVHTSLKNQDPTTKTATNSYFDFGEAPNDTLADLNQFARKVRKGQSKFRNNLINLYKGRCAITGEAVLSVLEAAHILDHAEAGVNHTDNGILLRSDIHLLFDKNLLKINPGTYRVEICNILKGCSYWQFNGTLLRARINGEQPSKKFLVRKYFEQ
ncbi:MAG: HNH endonuclease [Candidatus Thiodiazotropha taylori]|nr:HNH endonuclease [Candidatus Thiodiazotropha taylori]